jgi:hypothetical protein
VSFSEAESSSSEDSSSSSSEESADTGSTLPDVDSDSSGDGLSGKGRPTSPASRRAGTSAPGIQRGGNAPRLRGGRGGKTRAQSGCPEMPGCCLPLPRDQLPYPRAPVIRKVQIGAVEFTPCRGVSMSSLMSSFPMSAPLKFLPRLIMLLGL